MQKIVKFSICIPTYDRGPDLMYTIKSVIEQSYQHWELKVIDDSRNSDTELLVKSLNDSRIEYIKNATRLGLVRNWNECLKRAVYDYCMILHHDDFLVKDALLNYKKFIDLHPLANFIHANSYTANLPFTRKAVCNLKPKQMVLNEGDEGILDIMFNYGMTCSTVIIHKSCIDKVGYYDEECWVSPDWEYSARIAQYFKTYFLKVPTVVYVYHSNNVHTNAYDVSDFSRQSRFHYNKVKTYLKVIPECADELAEAGLLRAIKGLAVIMFTEGKYLKSLKFFKYARMKVTYKTLLWAIYNRTLFIYRNLFFRKISYRELFENNFENSIK